MGLMSAVAPLAAQTFGAGNTALARRSLCAGLWVGMAVYATLLMLRFQRLTR